MPTTYELETLVTYFTAEVRDLKARLKEAERALESVGKVADREAKGVDRAFLGLGGSAVALTASVLGLGGAMATVFRGVKLAADAEALATTFRVLVGDVEKADTALRDLEKFALTTPFEMPELMESSKMMLAFGEDVENIVPAMRMMGDVAAGVDQPLKDLAYLFGTLRSQGRAFTIDIRQFAMRGIPIYLELAKVLGLVDKAAKKTTTSVRQQMDKMIEHGDVNFEQVEEAFKRMTGPGGQFFGMMEARSKTLKGLFNEMKESIDISLREVGKSLIESLDLKSVVRQVTKLTEQFNAFLTNLTPQTKEAVKIVLVLTAAFVALAAAIFVAGAVFNVMTGGMGIWIGLAVTSIALGTAWAVSVGGLDRAWRKLKRAVEDFSDFLRPLGLSFTKLLFLVSPVGAALFALASDWENVSARLQDFWGEAQPVLRALWDLLKVVAFTLRDNFVTGMAQAATGVKNLGRWVKHLAVDVEEIYNNLTEGQQQFIRVLGVALGPVVALAGAFKQLGTVTRDEMRDILFFAEYTWKNFGGYTKLAMEQSKLYLYSFALDFAHFFESTVPKALQWFGENWKQLFVGFFQVGQTFTKNFLMMLVDGIVSIPDIIAGKVDISDILLKHTGEFRKTLEKAFEGIKPPKFDTRQMTQQEREAIERIQKAEFDLTIGFDKFKADKLRLWEVQDVYEAGFELGEILANAIGDVKSEAGQAGTDSGNSFMKEFSKAVEKWDATLFDSAEAKARIQQFKNLQPVLDFANRPVPQRPKEWVNPLDPTDFGPFEPPPAHRQIPQLELAPLPREIGTRPDQVAPPPRQVGQGLEGAMLRVLLQIAANTLATANKEPVVFQPADINE